METTSVVSINRVNPLYIKHSERIGRKPRASRLYQSLSQIFVISRHQRQEIRDGGRALGVSSAVSEGTWRDPESHYYLIDLTRRAKTLKTSPTPANSDTNAANTTPAKPCTP